MQTQNNFNIQGHRGCRGLMPENTVPAFIKAVVLGVTTIELDVVITKDNKVVVSHEPWMHHEICLDKNGNEISAAEEMQLNIYHMNYDDVKLFDCGSKIHPHLLTQQKLKTYKPLLSEVIDSIENYCISHQLKKINYNIEIKSLPQGDNLFHPTPEIFCQLVVEVLKQKNISKFNLQSFDFRILKYLKQHYPEIKLAILIENKFSVEENINELGFAPHIYSPDFNLVNENIFLFCRKNNMQLIPWTVNDKNKMQELIKLGVDGIITDYPDLLIEVFKNQ